MTPNTQIRVVDIVEGTSVDGPGLRTSVYFAGCRHKCPGCHNPQTWDFQAGKPMTIDEIIEVIADNDFDVTLSGGDPLYHPRQVLELTRVIKEKLGKTIWLYTGFTFEEITDNPSLRSALEYVDTIVEGPFIESLKTNTLPYRGSSNQRIIHLK